MDWIALIPVAAYFGLHLVRPRPIGHRLWPAFTLWAAFLVMAGFTLSRLPSRLFYPDNRAVSRMTSEAARLQNKSVRKNDVVLLIEGSSLVTCDISPTKLERLLRERGLPARVMQISAGGSNHFERVAMLREWLRGLSPGQAKALRKARVFLLEEVLFVYDEIPLHGFAENAFGARSVVYASPENLVPMIRSVWDKSQATQDSSAALIPLIIEHAFFHVFRVGAFPCIRPPATDYSVSGGEGIPIVVAPRRATKRSIIEACAVPYPWWRHGHESLEHVVAGWVDEAGYLALPAGEKLETTYRDKFFAALPPETFRLDGSAALPLISADHWLDKSHLNPAGAKIFTAWLADQIAANWPRISGTPEASKPIPSNGKE